MKTITFIALFLSLTTTSYGSENDSISTRHIEMEDTSTYFTNYMNEKLDLLVKKANKSKHSCSRRVLLKKAKNLLVADERGIWIFSPTQLEIDLKKAPIKTYKIRMRDSIYKYVKPIHAPVLKAVPLSAVMGFNGLVLGSDKFSHFFNLGWSYYKKLSKGKDSLVDVLKHSQTLESNFWGGPTTGVISYADLAANFQGLRFFGHLSAQGVDPLTGLENAQYSPIGCVDGKFKRVKDFNWDEYLNQFVDEGMNCNVYYRPQIKEAIGQAIFELEESGQEYRCPLKDNICDEGKEYFKEYAPYLLSPVCF